MERGEPGEGPRRRDSISRSGREEPHDAALPAAALTPVVARAPGRERQSAR